MQKRDLMIDHVLKVKQKDLFKNLVYTFPANSSLKKNGDNTLWSPIAQFVIVRTDDVYTTNNEAE